MNANHELREAAKSTATTRSPKQWTRQLTRDRLALIASLGGPFCQEIEILVTNGPPHRGRPLMAGPTLRPSLAERRLVAVPLAERACDALSGTELATPDRVEVRPMAVRRRIPR
jgi:hypothetical protein